jgi:hypothetical protein
MKVASTLINTFRFVSLSAIIFTIAFMVQPLLGEEIDPRDYIGEDISKYPPHLRQQIESAFFRETGERFTGSQYDPRSPAYAFKKRPPQTIYEEEMSPEEKYGTSRFLESRIRSDPSSQSSFDYSQLDEKDIKSIAGRIQLEEKRRRENPYLEEELKYKEKILKSKTLELELKKVEQELKKNDNKSNTEKELQYEVDDAKIALEALNPSDFDFIIKVTEIQKKYPLAFKHEPFIKNVLNPILLKRASAQ